VGYTASPWQIQYPDPGERPQLAADTIYYMAQRMDDHLSSWRSDDDRLRRRPAAKVTYDSTVQYKINSQALNVVYYNNVQCDTAGMVDLQRRPDRLYFPRNLRPALFVVGGTVVGNAAVQPSVPDIRLNTNAQWSLDLAPTPDVLYPFTTRDQNQDRGDVARGETFQVSSQILTYFPTTGGGQFGEIWAQIEINSGIDFTVRYADLWAFWSTDIGNIPST
jgi:hypothetical protein